MHACMHTCMHTCSGTNDEPIIIIIMTTTTTTRKKRKASRYHSSSACGWKRQRHTLYNTHGERWWWWWVRIRSFVSSLVVVVLVFGTSTCRTCTAFPVVPPTTTSRIAQGGGGVFEPRFGGTRLPTPRTRPNRPWHDGSLDQHGAITSTSSRSSSGGIIRDSPADRFQADLERVLTSRRRSTATTTSRQDVACSNHNHNTTLATKLLQRTTRPTLLTDDVDGAERAYAMLQHMIGLGMANESSFQLVMEAFVRRGRCRWRMPTTITTKHQEEDDTDIDEEYHHHHPGGGGAVVVVCAADVVHDLWQQLECQQDMDTIDSRTTRLALEAYANCATPRGDRNYAARAQALLDRTMEADSRMYQSVEHVAATNTTTTNNSTNHHFNEHRMQSLMHVLHAWSWQQANQEPGTCAKRAQDLLNQLEEELGTNRTIKNVGDSDCVAINTSIQTEEALMKLMQCYDWVLEAWSKSSSDGSSEKADALFQRMRELQQTHFGNVISSFDDDNGPLQQDSFGSALPNAVSYSNVILAWSKCPGAPAVRRAHQLLLEMVDAFRTEPAGFLDGSEPELIAFNGVITAWARLGRPDQAESILWLMVDLQKECQYLIPDVLTYNAVLHAHVKSRDKEKALERIIDIVEHMEENWRDQPAIRPESFTYNTLMKAWVQSGRQDAPEQVEAILTKMERLADSSIDRFDLSNRHFNVLINAYAKSNDRLAAQKAHGLLKRMQDSEHVQPDIISFTSVIECYSKSGDSNASEIAEQLLSEAFEQYHASDKDPALMPNLRTFTMVILSLARCRRQGNASRARAHLEQLLKLYELTQDERLKPNEYPYNYVLNSAANTLGTTEDKIQAFRLATQTYQDMRKSSLVSPDSFTYAFWIKACNNLLPASDLYDKCVRLAFEQCKRDGLVSTEVLSRLQQGASFHLCRTLLEEASSTEYKTLRVSDLPPQWTRNTKIGRKRRF